MELPVLALASHKGGAETHRPVLIPTTAIVDVGSSMEVLVEYVPTSGLALDALQQMIR